MGRYVSKALQLRYELQAKFGRKVTQREVADEVSQRIGRPIDRRVIARLENNEVREIDADILNHLANYFHDHGLDSSKVWIYDPDAPDGSETNETGDKTRGNRIPSLVAV